MKVKDLKQLLSEVPDDLSIEEFDEIDVLIPVDETLASEPCIIFKSPSIDDSGLISTDDGLLFFLITDELEESKYAISSN